MKWKKRVSFLFLPVLLLLCACGGKEEASADNDPATEQEVREQTRLYIEAVNNKELDKSAEFWSDEAIYKNPVSGKLVRGRKGIKSELAKVFDALGNAKVEFQIEALKFPVEGKASEKGTVILTEPGEEPVQSDYKMIHVKENGKWLILHVSQLDFGVPANKAQK